MLVTGILCLACLPWVVALITFVGTQILGSGVLALPTTINCVRLIPNELVSIAALRIVRIPEILLPPLSASLVVVDAFLA